MQTLVKTTITLPEDLIMTAKLTALTEHTSVSALLREALTVRLYPYATDAGKKTARNPLRYLGSIRAGIGRAYRKRADLYDKHVRHAVAG